MNLSSPELSLYFYSEHQSRYFRFAAQRHQEGPKSSRRFVIFHRRKLPATLPRQWPKCRCNRVDCSARNTLVCLEDCLEIADKWNTRNHVRQSITASAPRSQVTTLSPRHSLWRTTGELSPSPPRWNFLHLTRKTRKL